MSKYNKVIIEIVHNVDYQSVYHLQFHPSPILFCGNKEIATGNGQPFGTNGILTHLKKFEEIKNVNIYTNLNSSNLDELLVGFKEDCPKASFVLIKI
jgi:hypothetical protein